jgi:hypothetical protein
MAQDLDLFPLYDAITRSGADLSPVWRDALATYHQTLLGYLSQFGIFTPTVTTKQRDSIQQPQPGQIIYNSTLKKFQGYENTSWKTFTLT